MAILGNPNRNDPAGIRAWNLGLGGVTASLSSPTSAPIPGAPPPPAGSPAGVLGATSAAPAAPAPAAGGGGMTGGQFGLAALSGVASFLGGYQRNPGLLQISRNMSGALAYDIQQKQLAAAQAAHATAVQAATGAEPINTAKSAAEAKNRFLQAGMIDEAMKFAQLEDRYIDNAREQAKEDRQAVEADENQFLSVYGRRIQKHLDTTDAYDRVAGIIDQGRTNPRSLSDAQRGAIVIAFAKQQSPEALSDTEYSRNIRDRNVGVLINMLRGPLGALGISSGQVLSDTGIGNLAEVVHQNAVSAAHQINRIAALGKVGGKSLDLPTMPVPGSFGAMYKGVPSEGFAKGGLVGSGKEAARNLKEATKDVPILGPVGRAFDKTGITGILDYLGVGAQ